MDVLGFRISALDCRIESAEYTQVHLRDALDCTSGLAFTSVPSRLEARHSHASHDTN
jgi:hypothetical protein